MSLLHLVLDAPCFKIPMCDFPTFNCVIMDRYKIVESYEI